VCDGVSVGAIFVQQGRKNHLTTFRHPKSSPRKRNRGGWRKKVDQNDRRKSLTYCVCAVEKVANVLVAIRQDIRLANGMLAGIGRLFVECWRKRGDICRCFVG
jgi:hypothetical protein